MGILKYIDATAGNSQMGEARQQEYINLINQLLQCDTGMEANVLDAYADLVNEDFLRMLLISSHIISQSEEPKDESKIESLNNLILQIAAYLEIDLGSKIEKDEHITKFLKQKYTEIIEDLSQGNSDVRQGIGNPGISLPNEIYCIPEIRVRRKNVILGDKRSKPRLTIKRYIDSILKRIQRFIVFVLQQSLSLWFSLLNRVNPSSDPQIMFLIRVFQSIAVGKRDPQFIYSIFKDNLLVIDKNLISVLEDFHQNIFTKATEANKQHVANNLTVFANLIQLFPLGNRLDNLEIALSSYQLVLEVFKRKVYPELWARTQMNIGNIYQSRIQGERATNLEESIVYYQLALDVCTREAFSDDWVRIQMNLANTYLQRIYGERAANLEHSITCYHLALEVCTYEVDPELWAMTQLNLGNAYRERIKEEKATNIEIALSCCQLALEVFTPSAYPEQWAMAQMNLAAIYQDRIYENRAANIEESIAHCQLALDVSNRATYPELWAKIQLNLGNAYGGRILGNRLENLEESITCYQLALKIFRYGAYPQYWALVQNNLANAYQSRIRGERAENLEKSIVCYHLALQVYTNEAYPQLWAMTQMNLANAYRDRIRGEQAENLEDAIYCCHLALQIFGRDSCPEDWAKTQMILGGAYLCRICGEKAQNLEDSIDCFYRTLEVYTRTAFPEHWAMTQMNLGIAYKDRIRGRRVVNLSESIARYQLALEVRNRDANPEDWATTQMNLANTYQKLIVGGRAADIEESSLQAILEKAMTCYGLALDVFTCEAYPERWAMMQENIAILHAAEGQNELAIAHYQQALEILQPETSPLLALKANWGLGDIFFKQGNWQLAIDVYPLAMQSVEISRIWSASDESRQEILRNALMVYENAIQSAVNLGNYQLAIEYTERVRSRQLVELMASKDLYDDAQVPIEIQSYLTEYQQLNEDINNLRESGDRTMSATKTSRDSQALRADNEKIGSLADRKQILYDKIRAYDPVLAGQIAIAPISYSDIQKLITNAHTAILTCYSTNDHTHIFILKHNQEPELFTCAGQGWNEFQQWLIENWRNPYQQEDNSAWRDRMPLVLAEIAERLQLSQLIANYLSGIQELVLVPHLLLHQIPFAALPTGNSEELLGDRFIIRSIPSCQILKYCQDRSPILTSTQGIVEDADDSLLGARYEGQKIAEIHGVREIDRLRGKSQATIANYRQLLSRVNRLHSSHHASSNLENPLESALFLADGKITLGDLLMGEKYPNLDEIFLSACETHLGKFTFTDDVATLTTGFLCIGARSVQSTLWSVDDLVTALFDIFYHEARRDGFDRARSLQAAQKKLRNLTGEEFKLDRYPEIEQFLNELVPVIEQQIEQLENIMTTAAREDKSKISAEIARLEAQYLSSMSLLKSLNLYNQQTQPFEAPFYWAGFICQGMA
jgi:CHAT domain-containing protein